MTAAHAQTAGLEDVLAGVASAAEAEGSAVVAGPVMDVTGAGGVSVSHDVDLEAGVTYVLSLVSEEGSGFNPDVFVFDPDSETVATGRDVAERETVQFTAPSSGEYTFQIVVFDCAGSCPYGFVLVSL